MHLREVHSGLRSAHRLRLLLLLIALLIAACGGPSPAPPAGMSPAQTTPANLTVFAAASLTDAFGEIGAAVEAANPGTKVAVNVAGSSALRAQLREGARADLLAAADEPTMQAAQQDGTIGGEPRIFVQNKLVAIVPARNAAGLRGLPDLARPGVKLVLAQQEVPVGNYARQALDKMSEDAAFGGDFASRALTNLVSEEANVRQVVAKVQLGEADAGIVYSSDVTPAVRPQVKVIEIPDQFNVIARYPIAVVTGAANEAGARAFVEYLLSPAGQATLARHGFIPVAAATPATAEGDGRGPTAGAFAARRSPLWDAF